MRKGERKRKRGDRGRERGGGGQTDTQTHRAQKGGKRQPIFIKTDCQTRWGLFKKWGIEWRGTVIG